MLKIRVIKSVAPRVRYFCESPALSDDERVGQWLGEGSRFAGLGGAVTARDFKAGLEGFGPDGMYLGQRRNPERRAGWDVVLTTNKSVSIAALCAGEEIGKLVREGWDAAVREFIPILEALACRGNRSDGTIPTGNLAVAAFTHERSRRNDPLLHTHFVILNATLDHANRNAWRGLEPAPIFRHNLLLDAAFQRELHLQLRKRGLPASLDAKRRVQLPVPDELCARLSKAKTAIDEALAKLPLRAIPVRVWHIQTKRARLNDILRPAKTLPPGPAQSLVTDDEQAIMRRMCAPRDLAKPPQLPIFTPEDASREIARRYRASALWDTPKRLFSSMLDSAQTFWSEPITVFLQALSLVPPPRGDAPAKPAATLSLGQVQQLRHRRVLGPALPLPVLARPSKVPSQASVPPLLPSKIAAPPAQRKT